MLGLSSAPLVAAFLVATSSFAPAVAATPFDLLIPSLDSPSSITCKSSAVTSSLGLPPFNSSTYPARVDLGPVCLRQAAFTCCSAAHSEALLLRLLECEANDSSPKAVKCRGALAALRCYACEGTVGMLGEGAAEALPICSGFAAELYRSCTTDEKASSQLFFRADESTALAPSVPQICSESDLLCAPFTELHSSKEAFFSSLGLKIASKKEEQRLCWDGRLTSAATAAMKDKQGFSPSADQLRGIEGIANAAKTASGNNSPLQPAGAAGGGFKATARKRRGMQQEEEQGGSAAAASSFSSSAVLEAVRRAIYVHLSPFVGGTVAAVLARNLEAVGVAIGAILLAQLFLLRTLKQLKIQRTANTEREAAFASITRWAEGAGVSSSSSSNASNGGGDAISEEERQRRLALLAAARRRLGQGQRQEAKNFAAVSAATAAAAAMAAFPAPTTNSAATSDSHDENSDETKGATAALKTTTTGIADKNNNGGGGDGGGDDSDLE